MHSWLYLLFNLLVFIPVFLLSLFTDVKPHKKWRSLLAAYTLVSIPFILIDYWATRSSLWSFNELYILSYRVLLLPSEEILFFLTVPFAMMYVWGVVRKHVKHKPMRTSFSLFLMAAISTVSITTLIIFANNTYTMMSTMLAFVTVCIIAATKLVFDNRFWIFQIALLGIFVMANIILTSMPIIIYNNAEIIGVKLSTIPIEDFFFNFAFINLFLICFNWLDNRTK